jgi:hypothetical protein
MLTVRGGAAVGPMAQATFTSGVAVVVADAFRQQSAVTTLVARWRDPRGARPIGEVYCSGINCIRTGKP